MKIHPIRRPVIVGSLTVDSASGAILLFKNEIDNGLLLNLYRGSKQSLTKLLSARLSEILTAIGEAERE